MSVEQRIKISCDNFECEAAIHSGVGLTAARTITGRAGWVNTLHFVAHRAILQDFCPDHREQTFDSKTFDSKMRAQRVVAKPIASEATK
ncbi:hypothetical protein ASC66_01090 [Leifsonia sp. Root4]|uniref:hypothetical protein n=1 Tax=Leifsonia sp. Root4 TaxID=1736525 RepID=UPI0006F64554|nr:hypothetical protein [Leifsonia sp. Root4]KQW07624.1 hypothetical protein ASC66_01090 [Leifsonia sp. Root4]